MTGETGQNSYRELIADLPFGKTLPDAVYVHASGISQLPRECWDLVRQAQSVAELKNDRFNVVKFSRGKRKLSLLAYPRFFEDGFPVLDRSWTVDLDEKTCSDRAYAADENPPILHRKELLLHPEHPAIGDFAALTRQVEGYGLLEQTSEIGSLLPWQAKLDRLRLEIRGNEVLERGAEPRAADASVQRERTALSRYALSSPVQALWRHGFLDGRWALFDYGCGRGDDVRILGALGVEASGWDPYFRPDGIRAAAELVNLGFVLNVIEDRKERADALAGAWQLTENLLVVAALVGNRSEYERHRLYRDGVLTRRGTFQKYFSQAELRDYIAAVLERSPVAVAPGIYFVFRTDEDEQGFLEARYGGLPSSRRSIAYDPSAFGPREPRGARRQSKWAMHQDLVEEYWQACLSVGRMAEIDEFPQGSELSDALGSSKRVFNRLLKERGSSELDEARSQRRADLSVFFALDVFERHGRLRDLSQRIQRDVRSLWGSHANALTHGKHVLFEAGSLEHLASDGQRVVERGLGLIDNRGHLNVRYDVVRQLPTRLRVFIGCAERVFGDLSGYELLRIHLESKKLTLLAFDGFGTSPLPRLRKRVKILLARADFIEFDYPSDGDAPLLYWKSLHLPEGAPDYERQRAFDAHLESLGWHKVDGWPFSDGELRAALERRGLQVRGYRIVRKDQGLGTGLEPGLIDPFPDDRCRATNPPKDQKESRIQVPEEGRHRAMTIIQAVSQVLEEASKPMTAREIHDQVVAKGLFTFGAKDPVSMVRSTILKRLRKGSDQGVRIEQVGRDQFGWKG